MLFSIRGLVLTCGQIIELLSFEIQCVLVSKKICVIQGRLIHELECLGDQEDGEDDQIDLPSNAFVLQAQNQF